MAHADAWQNGEGCKRVAMDKPGERPLAAFLSTLFGQQNEPASCPHCGGGRIYSWGTSNSGRRRRGCRGCRRTFSAATGTSLLGVHDLAKLQALLALMLEGDARSCRALALDLQVGKNTVWRWRAKIMSELSKLDASPLERVVVAQRHVVRESRKASREWVRHAADPSTWPAPDRPRWIDVDCGRLPEPLPREAYRIPILAVLDEVQDFRATLRSRPWTTARATDMVRREDGSPKAGGAEQLDAYLVAHDRNPQGDSSPEVSADACPFAAAGGKGCPEAPGATLRRFLQPFRGPATVHLQGYLAWFNATHCRAALQSLKQALAMLTSLQPTRFGDISFKRP